MSPDGVPDEWVTAFDEGAYSAACARPSHPYSAHEVVAAESAYQRGGIAAVLPLIRAKIAEEIGAEIARGWPQPVTAGLTMAQKIARDGER